MSCWCDGDDPGCEMCRPGMEPEARAAARAAKQVRDAGPDLVRALLAVEYIKDGRWDERQCPACGALESKGSHLEGCSTDLALKKAGVR